ncbi:hypothetical protein ASE63_03090 [Bosea sp. Root381]|uniref:hypothetical protein n=1 Tax=Bosea sp. Root381 TaxID=1736524 RepID=UPI0006FAB3D3|nr:hypothetical protein [Bosea sp. Root381]KRE18174.1 hypothetical protein ASE63_03090 [Bosea sp. Root381]
MVRRHVILVGLVAALSAAGIPGAQANPFEELARAIFGGGQRLRATPIYEYDDERPRAHRQQQHRAPEASSKPKPPAVQLDPATDPHWYLKDPTLRRGDIIVTADGVMVYQGRGRDGIRDADFTALGGKDGKGWKQQLQAAAAGGRNFFDSTSAPPRPSVQVEAASVQ